MDRNGNPSAERSEQNPNDVTPKQPCRGGSGRQFVLVASESTIGIDGRCGIGGMHVVGVGQKLELSNFHRLNRNAPSAFAPEQAVECLARIRTAWTDSPSVVVERGIQSFPQKRGEVIVAVTSD